MSGIPEGAPIWADAMLPDLEAGKAFYGELFGWTFDEPDPEFGNYTTARLDGLRVAALAPVQPGMEMPAVWSLYLGSPDVDATAARITENGGQLVMGPMTVGDYGRMLMAQDPGGAVFGVWQPETHTGFEKKYEPGSFGWGEICVRDPAAVDDFYAAVFPITARQLGDGSAFDFKIWEVEGQTVASRFKLGPETPAEVPPHAMVYFAVADCDEAAAAVTKLGGEVKAPPRTTPFGRLAIVTDQQGAHFTVIDPGTTEAAPSA